MVRILINFPTNIGDVVLALPVLDRLRANYPESFVTACASPRTKEFLSRNTMLNEIVVFDKEARGLEKLRFLADHYRAYDIIVDLKHSLLPILLNAPRHTPFIRRFSNKVHIEDKYLRLVERLAPLSSKVRSDFTLTSDEMKRIDSLAAPRAVVLACSSRSRLKRYPVPSLVRLCASLAETSPVIILGMEEEREYYRPLLEMPNVRDLLGKTSLWEAFYCLKNYARLVIGVDSSLTHMASYLDIPVIALFGPTSFERSCPRSRDSVVLRKDLACIPCERTSCRAPLCMDIEPDRILEYARRIMKKTDQPAGERVLRISGAPRRILIIRTDRIGDSILSTPVIENLRKNFPDAHIAFMCRPYTRGILEGNPYLDEIILYDKDAQHRSGMATVRFALSLRRKNFDWALILHPTNRTHLIAFMAGIPVRVGWDRKLSWLLTRRLPHTKQEGKKHELEYTLDILRALDIPILSTEPYFPVTARAREKVETFLGSLGLTDATPLIAMHAGASCPSKRWPRENFAELADLLKKTMPAVVIFIGETDPSCSFSDIGIDARGIFDLKEVGALLQRCRLFISNDSGPVHIAAALKVPVIALFGRDNPGISPRRWGPLGEQSYIMHGKAGCETCQAHNCTRGFACLKNITPEAVFKKAARVLGDIKPGGNDA